MKQPEVEYYKSTNGDWRWRIRHPNGNVVADSAEGYRNRLDAVAGYEAAQSAE